MTQIITKKEMIINYFENSDLMISSKRLRQKFNISNTYLRRILKELILNEKIVKISTFKIKYYQKKFN